MRIGIDCDGVLRDFIPDLINKIKETHPEHADKIGIPHSWDWEEWLPFWTEDETEKYVFEDHFEELFGPEASVIETSLKDWPVLKEWAKEQGHELTPKEKFELYYSEHRRRKKEKEVKSLNQTLRGAGIKKPPKK